MLRKLLLNSKSISGVRLTMGRTVEAQKCLSYTAATYGEQKSAGSASPHYKCTSQVLPIRLGMECCIGNVSGGENVERESEGIEQASQALKSKRSHCDNVLANLFDSGLLSDYRIAMLPFSIRAHKSILAASSPFFRKLFAAAEVSNSKDQEEQIANKVFHIENYRFYVVRAVVYFIYTGRINWASYDGLEKDLLRLAQEWELPELKADLEQHYLLHGINSAERLVEFAKLAETVDSPPLMKVCANYLATHRHVVLTSQVWGYFSVAKSNLAVKLLEMGIQAVGREE